MTKPQQVGVAPAETAAPGDVQMELAAMQVVGSAIGGLRDHDARLRILNWAMERFHPDLAKSPNGTPISQAASADLDLFADNLDGLFEKATPVKVDPQSMDNLDGLFEIDAPLVTIGPRAVENLDGLFEIESPVMKVDAPVVKVDAPVVKGEAPVVKVDAPVAKVDVPVVKVDVPVAKVDAPVVKIGPRPVENVRLFEIDAPVGNIGLQSGQPQPELGSLFRDFVAELQQLADEMQGT
jgi:hypothetical protein